MALGPGIRLGAYEILSLLGSGGMGEVYRAKDTKLGRDVALKILPNTFTHDPERLARFRREAQVLAALNHPHIGAIYGLDEANGTQFLVLELVDGESLDRRIARGPIPVEEALAIAKQIAEALEAAHERGIIHRDLKPANIALTKDGNVKVLDFGLAKATEAASGTSFDVMNSPTITSPAIVTGVGMILGTAAYMSPEQAKGRPADKRSDVWAFGVVLYEMLTGKRAFEGEDVGDTLAAVLRAEPDWNALPNIGPPPILLLVKRCLEKDRRTRVSDIAVAKFLLTEHTAFGINASVGRTPDGRRWRNAALVLTIVLVGVSVLSSIRSMPSGPMSDAVRGDIRFTIPQPEGMTFGTLSVDPPPALSPDGHRVAFTARTQDGKATLWVRLLSAVDSRPVAGTDNAAFPFWSPDGDHIAFFSSGKLKKIDLTDGTAKTICDAVNPLGGTWNSSGLIVFGTTQGGLFRVSATGGEPQQVTTLDPGRQEVSHGWPWFLPDGNHVFYLARRRARDEMGIEVVRTDGQDRRPVVTAISNPVFAAPDVLLYARTSTGHHSPLDSPFRSIFETTASLIAQRIDPKTYKTIGSPSVLLDRIRFSASLDAGAFSASASGVLVYRDGVPIPNTRMKWIDRGGRTISDFGGDTVYPHPELSPDGRKVVFNELDPSSGVPNIWVADLTNNRRTRLTFSPSIDALAVWSPDGNSVAFTSDRTGPGDLYVKRADGSVSEELLLHSEVNKFATSWSPDGRAIAFQNYIFGSRIDTWLVNPASRTAEPLLRANYTHAQLRFSPDGRWFVYNSNESGRPNVYVQAFPLTGGKWQISHEGGTQGRWRGDGKELFYISGDWKKMMAVDVRADGSALQIGVPHELFPLEVFPGPPTPRNHYAVSQDGQRFLIDTITSDIPRIPLNVILNWTVAWKR